MKRYLFAWIALGIGLVLTIIASLEVKKAIEQDVANEFAFTSDQVTISYASAWATLAGGVVLSSLLCGLMLALARTQARAREIADTLTEELRISGDLLRESEARLTSLLDETKIHIWAFDGTRYKFFNKQWYDFTGQKQADGMTIDAWTSVMHPDDLPIATETWLKHWATKTEHENFFRLRRHDGVYRDFFCHTLPVLDKNGVFQAFQGFNLDITERKQAEEALRQSEVTFRKLFTDSSDPILLIDSTGVFVECNQAALTLLKMTREQFLLSPPASVSPEFQPDGRRSAESAPEMIALAYGKGLHRFDWICIDSEGGEFIVEMSLMPIVLKGQTFLHVTWRDISERKAHQEQLEHIAHYDNLTGLPNRALLADRLHQAMTQALRRKTLLAVAFLDLDGFKAINDHYGHKAGDYLLTTLSGKMRQALREGDTLARLGGDEFVAILLDLPDVESSALLLSRLLTVTAEVVHYEGNALRVSASLGVTFYPQAEAIDADQLVRQADQAMYQAKQSGKNRYHIFDTEQDRSVGGHHKSIPY